MAAGIAGDAKAATSSLRRRRGGGGFQGHGICPRRRQRHPVRHLCHEGAEPDHERGKNHYVTHHAKLDQRNRNITTPAAKPRPMAAGKVAILAKRMTEELTAPVAAAVIEAPKPKRPAILARCIAAKSQTRVHRPSIPHSFATIC